jgi:chemotaxis protein methyltransferase CheR
LENNFILQFFAKYVESELGIVYLEANYFQLEHRLKEIASIMGMGGIDELYHLASNGIDGKLKNLLLDMATNNETSFFRDVSVFKALSEFMVPTLLASEGKTSINIWSAASSSGQEAYSIAMELQEYKQKSSDFFSFTILVSDISEAILKRASEGKYSKLEVQRGLSSELLNKYFHQADGDSWQVKSSLSSVMTFKKINLLNSWDGIGPFDIIFVRNVLIYQSVENKKKIIGQIHKKLNPNGFLVMGAAESLFGISDEFKQLSHGTSIVYQKN